MTQFIGLCISSSLSVCLSIWLSLLSSMCAYIHKSVLHVYIINVYISQEKYGPSTPRAPTMNFRWGIKLSLGSSFAASEVVSESDSGIFARVQVAALPFGKNFDHLPRRPTRFWIEVGSNTQNLRLPVPSQLPSPIPGTIQEAGGSVRFGSIP